MNGVNIRKLKYTHFVPQNMVYSIKCDNSQCTIAYKDENYRKIVESYRKGETNYYILQRAIE